MSLLYECIHTVIAGGMLATTGTGSNAESANTLAATCVTKLRTFLEDPDQNCELQKKPTIDLKAWLQGF